LILLTDWAFVSIVRPAFCKSTKTKGYDHELSY
jgi:hypothetical protein